MYPRLVSTSRVKKNEWGVGNVAIDPFLPPPATRTRFFALTSHAGVVLEPAELVLLRIAAAIAPGDARRESRREPSQSRFILVGDRLLVGLRDRFHAKQVRAAIRREMQASREDAHRESREVHFNSRAVGLDAARIRFERRIGGADLLRFPRKTVHASVGSGRDRSPPRRRLALRSRSRLPSTRHHRRARRPHRVLVRAALAATPGITNGASQKAYHLFFSITSGVMSTPRLMSGAPCCVVMRRTPLFT